MILITGSEGLIGRHLIGELHARGFETIGLDVRTSPEQDTRNLDVVSATLPRVSGVVHLAAISRVEWAEEHPGLAQDINVTATRGLLDQLCAAKHRPWMIFGSINGQFLSHFHTLSTSITARGLIRPPLTLLD